ncbi:activator-dependent family glycosyltransferase [Streptomonospora litoralis]|uniref:Desosaminyl transferase EryCIII n=1 Tax=Streptomonospora litoralis TaxID=2498135 RepID=A0A4P6Q723_9ACTN|nr:activator-dependent family glycosyltransferase [Streptomonospora litoralis]QBI54889.1 Desosaminyl transferase EryCIII precursor [Streptomonospora litoralis]
MRVLFATVGEPSHLYAQVPTAWALLAAGHDVRVASGPAMTEVIASAGLPPVAVGEDHGMDELLRSAEDEVGSIENEIADWSDPFDERLTWEEVLLKYQASVPYGIQPFNAPILDGLVEYARAWQPDLVVWDPITYAGAVAARVVGAAHARLLWSVDIYSTMRETWRRLAEQQPPEERHDPLGEWLAESLREYGCTFDEEVVVGQWTIDQVPDPVQFDLPLQRVPVRYVPYHTRRLTPDWVFEQPERPRVAVSGRGSLDAKLNSSVFPVAEAVRAVADLDVEVVAVLTESEQEKLGPVPDNVRLVDFVPFQTLLPTCSAVVHHGGFGAASTAGLCGTPQLLLPIKHADAWVRAQHLSRAEAGLYQHAPGATAEGIRDQVSRLLEDPAIAQGAQRLQQRIADTPTPHGIVAELEDLTHKHRART